MSAISLEIKKFVCENMDVEKLVSDILDLFDFRKLKKKNYERSDVMKINKFGSELSNIRKLSH